jgi:TldD protein
MAALLAATLGPATQVDRALGYEANATGTSFLTDPLGMLGNVQIAAPLVTVTANRSAPTQLATVKWDAEGVVPDETTLIKNGVLMDFQTTREQASWLAPYYAKTGMSIRSHGYAAAEDALVSTIQMLPNLALTPAPSAIRLDDLIADVRHGILIAGGQAETDYQGRTGVLWPREIREIKNGRLGSWIVPMAVQFDTAHLWKHITALGGATTTGAVARGSDAFIRGGHGTAKGEPAQGTSYTVQAVAATILDQPLIDPSRKA